MAITVEFLEIREVARRCRTTVTFIEELAAAELVVLQSGPKGEHVLSAEDAERVRVGALLAEDLEVNLAGLEVILPMREAMVSMQRQFAEVLRAIADERRASAGDRPRRTGDG